ncbi:Sec23/Sec24 protein transport family protein [Actinidia rufa]|uniref:Protein transport protein SEC23 n=1 Tax=Actinidia rufa TaxID=165716 RepID=A0A7J0F0F0_9ERIC|nr:Sec23/Sec24 protein transport family protein [Actinidia rufa]
MMLLLFYPGKKFSFSPNLIGRDTIATVSTWDNLDSSNSFTHCLSDIVPVNSFPGHRLFPKLKVAVERTGGLVVLAESFGHSVFKDSLKRVFQSDDYDLCLSSNGIFEVNCSKDIRVQGIIGPCASLEKVLLCSETVVGQGSTSAWKMCGLDKATSLCLVFEIVKKEIPEVIGQSANNQFYFQFLT